MVAKRINQPHEKPNDEAGGTDPQHSIIGPDGISYALCKAKGSSRWYATWYNKAKGRYDRKSLGVSDAAEAMAALSSFVSEASEARQKQLEGDSAAEPSALTMASVWANYGAYLKRAKKPSLPHIEAAFNGALASFTMVSDLTRKRQKEYIAHLMSRGMKASTILKHMRHIHAGLKRAAKDELLLYYPPIIISEDDIEDITGQRVQPPALRRLSAREIARFLDAIEQHHFFRYCIIALCTMARPAAICDLTRASIDWEWGTVDLLPEGREQNKKKRRPTIPLLPAMAGWLGIWDAHDRVPHRMAPEADHRHWVERAGKRVDKLNAAFRSVAIRSGLVSKGDYEKRPDGSTIIKQSRAITPYTLRRSMATLLRASGVSLDDIAGLMGHDVKQREITEIYASLSPEQMGRVARGIEDILREISAETKIAPVLPDEGHTDEAKLIRWKTYGLPRPSTRESRKAASVMLSFAREKQKISRKEADGCPMIPPKNQT